MSFFKLHQKPGLIMSRLKCCQDTGQDIQNRVSPDKNWTGGHLNLHASFDGV